MSQIPNPDISVSIQPISNISIGATLVKIPANAETIVIKPKMQLSGGFAAVSLKKEKTC